MLKISGIILTIVAFLNLGWSALGVSGSEVWIPVPEDSGRIEDGRILVHVNWYRGEGSVLVPWLTAVSCLIAYGLQFVSERRSVAASRKTPPPC